MAECQAIGCGMSGNTDWLPFCERHRAALTPAEYRALTQTDGYTYNRSTRERQREIIRAHNVALSAAVMRLHRAPEQSPQLTPPLFER